MRRRCIIGAICLAAGCQSMRSNVPQVAVPVVAQPVTTKAVIEDKPTIAEKPIEVPVPFRGFKAQPTSRKKPDDVPAQDHLMLAADSMEKNDTQAAAEHLRQHISANPQQIMIRAYLAEMLFKSGQFDEAQWQFERFVADAQTVNGPASEHRLHCHSRLMEIAENRGDVGAEHLHRGIGMYLLACKSLKQEAAVEEQLPERLFLKATAELKSAQKLLPSDGRPSWYLHLSWTQLNQIEPSRIALRQAAELVETSTMTTSEKQMLRATAQLTR